MIIPLEAQARAASAAVSSWTDRSRRRRSRDRSERRGTSAGTSDAGQRRRDRALACRRGRRADFRPRRVQRVDGAAAAPERWSACPRGRRRRPHAVLECADRRQGRRHLRDERGRKDESLTDIEIVLTNRAASVAGIVTDARSRPAAGCAVLVFATDPDRWYQRFRFLTDHGADSPPSRVDSRSRLRRVKCARSWRAT